MTAVALDSGYQCHRCGREFAAGLVRVPAAWGSGGEAMAKAARLAIPYPETAVLERRTLAEQTEAVAASLPARPVVLGGCCCAHVGAVQGLVRSDERLAIVWLDAHGDLNTPESSPSGNEWGMPLRMILDAGLVSPAYVALVGARNLDPPEVEYLAATAIDDSLERALAGADRVYVAFDGDVLEPGKADVFMPEPGGLSLSESETLLGEVTSQVQLAGMGVTGFVPGDRNVAVITRLLAAAGL